MTAYRIRNYFFTNFTSNRIAKTGETMIQWSQLKGYFIFKLEKVMDDFRTSAPEPRGPPNPNVEYIPFDEMKERILKIVTGFNGISFNIQRLCELLTDPRRNYTGTNKFLGGVEKNVMVVSCVCPFSEKNSSNSLNQMNGVMFPGNSPNYSDRSNINGPGTPRPLNRPKLSLSTLLTTNALPESTNSKESDLHSREEKAHSSDSPASESEVSSLSPVKNKYPDDDTVEAEEHEVKRLRFDKEGDVRETASQMVSSEGSVRAGEAETGSSPPEKDRENHSRQHCTEDNEEEEEEEEEESFMTPREMVPERKKKYQEKEFDDALAVNEELSEEGAHMEGSDRSAAQRDPRSDRSDSAGAVSSGSDRLETEEPGGSTFRKMGESVSVSSMENDETAEVTDEPMEQDLTT